jgi:hypothetical protein
VPQGFFLRQEPCLYQLWMQVFATDRYDQIKECGALVGSCTELNSSAGSVVGKADYGLKASHSWHMFRFDRNGYIHPCGTLPDEGSEYPMVGRSLRELMAPDSSERHDVAAVQGTAHVGEHHQSTEAYRESIDLQQQRH